MLYLYRYTKKKKKILAEVVGFRDEMVILMPFTAVSDIGPGCIVEGSGRSLEIKVGSGLIGKVVDPLGHPIDDSAASKRTCYGSGGSRSTQPYGKASD